MNKKYLSKQNAYYFYLLMLLNEVTNEFLKLVFLLLNFISFLLNINK